MQFVSVVRYDIVWPVVGLLLFWLGYVAAKLAHREQAPFIKFDTEDEFVEWQRNTMLRTLVANGSLCQDGASLSTDPEHVYAQADEIRQRALEGPDDAEGEGPWTHDAEARATDGTIAWCGRTLGLIQEPKMRITGVDYAKAHAELSSTFCGVPHPRAALDLDKAFDLFTDPKANVDAERNARATEWMGKLDKPKGE